MIYQEKCYKYWPTERSARHQYYIVDPVAEQEYAQFVIRDFKVKDARVSYGYECLRWIVEFLWCKVEFLTAKVPLVLQLH